tara:strand:+ start:2277 stop:3266 length:990 start_codon:yes stop_codon:yes gene_type:complete
MIYTKDLEKLILTRHKQNQADELIILSGWTGPSPIQKLSQLPIQSKIIHGIKSQLHKSMHLTYQQITASTSTNVYIKNQYNHSKIYCWLKNKSPVDILSGSANLSTQGLNNSHEGETLFNIKSKAYPTTYQYIKDALKDSVLSTNYNLALTSTSSVTKKGQTKELDKVLSFNPPKAEIYVGGRGRKIQNAAGWNWGHGSGHNAKDCAEQRLRGDLIKSIPSLFPNNGVNINAGSGQSSRNPMPNAEIIFDDGIVMDISFEGLGAKNSKNQILFKQFSSYPNKNIYGRYIRKRLGLSPTAKISDSDLDNYGRDTITLELLSPGVYFCDFS